MQNLTFAQTLTLSSPEIAELVNRRHDNVKRTIETLIHKVVITSPQIEEKPTAGRPTTEKVSTGFFCSPECCEDFEKVERAKQHRRVA